MEIRKVFRYLDTCADLLFIFFSFAKHLSMAQRLEALENPYSSIEDLQGRGSPKVRVLGGWGVNAKKSWSRDMIRGSF